MREGLPRGWVIKNLKVILQHVKTGVPAFSGEKRYFSTGSINGNKHIANGTFIFENRPSRANRIATLNDVFQARMRETNKGFVIDEVLNDQLFSTGFLQLRVYNGTYNPRFLYYYH